MSGRQPVIATAVVLAAIALAACDRTGSANRSQVSGTVTLVNRVSARVRSEKCPACASALEAALRQRLDAVDISVGSEGRTIDLEFPPSSPFASGSFRDAVKAGGAEVQLVEIEACGTIDIADGQSWITSGSTRLLLEGAGPFVTGTEVCVTGELQDLVHPPRLVPGKRVNPPS